MDNPSLNQLQNHLNAKTEEAAGFRLDLSEMKQKVIEMERQLSNFIGGYEVVEDSKPSLRQAIIKVLSEANEPLTVSQISELILEQGYKTKAPPNNFKNMVQQTLGKDNFRRVTNKKARPSRYTTVE